MNTYRTSEVAHRNGIHPNTVRLYEELALIPTPEREPNGYRIFTDLHLEQIKLVRTALQVEVLQNGLRKKAIDIIKTSAAGNFDEAILLAKSYLDQVHTEQANAEEAIRITRRLLAGGLLDENQTCLSRKETADQLHISMDTLRNWEMNGLLTVKRKQNGYRVYTDEDIRRLKIIRSLRCANYSLMAILRMLNALLKDPQADIRTVINTPAGDDDIISVCDKLLTSLHHAEINAQTIILHLETMKDRFRLNPPL